MHTLTRCIGLRKPDGGRCDVMVVVTPGSGATDASMIRQGMRLGVIPQGYVHMITVSLRTSATVVDVLPRVHNAVQYWA
jgi:hypothetical protein